MASTIAILLPIVLFIVHGSASHFYYVQPTEPLLNKVNICEQGTDQPCHSLNYYAGFQNFTSGATLAFLPGNHSLSGETLTLLNVSNITLDGQSLANVFSASNVTIFCKNVYNVKIRGINFRADMDSATVLKIQNAVGISISRNTFYGAARSIAFSEQSRASISNSTFHKNKRSAVYVGYRCSVSITGCKFTENEGIGEGGAISAIFCYELILHTNYFGHNVDYCAGGAIKVVYCQLKIGDTHEFFNNSVKHYPNNRCRNYFIGGGALSASTAEITILGWAVFQNNFAHSGGAISLSSSKLKLQGNNKIIFDGNEALTGGGGGIYVRLSSLTITCRSVKFVNNSNDVQGGAIYIDNYDTSNKKVISNQIILSGYFNQNRANQGGAIYVESAYKIYFRSIEVINNSLTAIRIISSPVTFTRFTKFIQNYGGALQADLSTVDFKGDTLFSNNVRHNGNGGALHLLQGTLFFNGPTLFLENSADENGGAIYTIGTDIYLQNLVELRSNKARKNGGGMYFDTGTTITLKRVYRKQTVLLQTSDNHANGAGGAIYHVDTPTPAQCQHRPSIKSLPLCFLFIEFSEVQKNIPLLASHNDSYSRKERAISFGRAPKQMQNKFTHTSI